MPYILGHIKINSQVQWVINIPRNPNFLARGTSCKRSYLVDSLKSHCISVFLAVFLYFKAVRQAPPCSRSWPGWWLTHVGGDCQIARLGMSHSHCISVYLSLYFCIYCCVSVFQRCETSATLFLTWLARVGGDCQIARLGMSHSHWLASSKATLSLHICWFHISLYIYFWYFLIFPFIILHISFYFLMYLLMNVSLSPSCSEQSYLVASCLSVPYFLIYFSLYLFIFLYIFPYISFYFFIYLLKNVSLSLTCSEQYNLVVSNLSVPYFLVASHLSSLWSEISKYSGITNNSWISKSI